MSQEASFWRWLRGLRLPGRFTRIETETALGIPDVYFAFFEPSETYQGWIELKSLAAPKRMTAKPLKRKGLRPEQIRWIMDHDRLGVKIWIFVKLGRIVYVYRGYQADYLNNLTFQQLQLACFAQVPIGGTKKWTRSRFLHLLTHSSKAPFGSPSTASESASTGNVLEPSQKISRYLVRKLKSLPS